MKIIIEVDDTDETAINLARDLVRLTEDSGYLVFVDAMGDVDEIPVQGITVP